MTESQRSTDAKATKGRLILIPNTLDLGTWPTDQPAPDIQRVLPLAVLQQSAQLGHWVAESAKCARALLKRVHAVVPLAQALQDIDIQELPRAPKGGRGGAHGTGDGAWARLLQPCYEGHDLGLVSDAGLPAVADPGAVLVRMAHKAGITVVPLSGPSSIVLAVAASGLNGQSFAFVGYLPSDAPARIARLKELEGHSRRWQQTQLMIETPYRNRAFMQALVTGLTPTTWVSVSQGLTLDGGWTQTRTVAQWRGMGAERAAALLAADVPAVFALLAE